MELKKKNTHTHSFQLPSAVVFSIVAPFVNRNPRATPVSNQESAPWSVSLCLKFDPADVSPGFCGLKLIATLVGGGGDRIFGAFSIAIVLVIAKTKLSSLFVCFCHDWSTDRRV